MDSIDKKALYRAARKEASIELSENRKAGRLALKQNGIIMRDFKNMCYELVHYPFWKPERKRRAETLFSSLCEDVSRGIYPANDEGVRLFIKNYFGKYTNPNQITKLK